MALDEARGVVSLRPEGELSLGDTTCHYVPRVCSRIRVPQESNTLADRYSLIIANARVVSTRKKIGSAEQVGSPLCVIRNLRNLYKQFLMDT